MHRAGDSLGRSILLPIPASIQCIYSIQNRLLLSTQEKSKCRLQLLSRLMTVYRHCSMLGIRVPKANGNPKVKDLGFEPHIVI